MKSPALVSCIPGQNRYLHQVMPSDRHDRKDHKSHSHRDKKEHRSRSIRDSSRDHDRDETRSKDRKRDREPYSQLEKPAKKAR